MTVYWLLFGRKKGLQWRNAFAWLLYPLAYFAYALGRGLVDGKYPYPFMDLNKVSPLMALRNGLAIGLAFLLAGLAMIAVARGLAGVRITRRLG
jgi:hypothetical protein